MLIFYFFAFVTQVFAADFSWMQNFAPKRDAKMENGYLQERNNLGQFSVFKNLKKSNF